MKKAMSFWNDVCKEEIWKLPESPRPTKNLPEFRQQELATLGMVHLPTMATLAASGEQHKDPTLLRPCVHNARCLQPVHINKVKS